MTYDGARAFAGFFGLFFFIALFIGVLVYVFWPRNKARFERAARLPMEESTGEPGDESETDGSNIRHGRPGSDRPVSDGER
ncbi:MAG: cbb3-type cytochrome c oxidase subunit 3 [Alphaproteobacteria bacterium]